MERKVLTYWYVVRSEMTRWTVARLSPRESCGFAVVRIERKITDSEGKFYSYN